MPVLQPDVALQLYSLRRLRDPARIFAAAAGAGYTSVELLPTDLRAPHRTRTLLRTHDLVAPTAHVGLWTLDRRRARLLDVCAQLGVRSLIVSSVPRWRRTANEAYWRRTGSRLTELAAHTAAAANIRIGYHNHGWEFRPLPGGITPLQALFQSDPDRLLRWQVDLGWLSQSTRDVGHWLDFGHGRIDSVHMREPDQESPAIWRKCAAAGATRLIIELDDPAEPRDACQRCLQITRQSGFWSIRT
jgi:sugar phosphate isomerase/epimerase